MARLAAPVRLILGPVAIEKRADVKEAGLPWQVAAVVAALLFIAVAPLPYGFYTLLRIAVCLAAAFSAYADFTGARTGWAIAWAVVAILFNPLIPVHLSKDIWMVLDIAAGALFAFAAYRGRQWTS
jgi:hypothetical protein